jgi:alkylation response protein AidB-like acyl-CoA dehydrogenase
MDFTLNTEQELIRESAREFVAREIEPYARDWDRSEAMDRGIVAKLASAGFLGSALPEEHGGMAHRERGGAGARRLRIRGRVSGREVSPRRARYDVV